MENNQADPQLYTLPEANPPQIADDKPGKNFDYKALVAFLILFVVSLLMLLAYLFTQVQQLRQQAEVTEFKEPGNVEEAADQTQTEQPQVNPTTNWKTYTGKGFSFQYPQNLILEQNELIMLRTPESVSPTDDPVLLVDARFILPYKNLAQAVNNNKDLDIFDQINLPNGVRIAGTIKKGEYRSGTQVFIAYFQQKEGVISVESVGGQIDLSLFDQILSTLKLATANIDKTTGWQQHSSNSGYSVKIPPNASIEEVDDANSNCSVITTGLVKLIISDTSDGRFCGTTGVDTPTRTIPLPFTFTLLGKTYSDATIFEYVNQNKISKKLIYHFPVLKNIQIEISGGYNEGKDSTLFEDSLITANQILATFKLTD